MKSKRGKTPYTKKFNTISNGEETHNDSATLGIDPQIIEVKNRDL